MIREPEAMREIHQIMEKLYESDKNKNSQEILAEIRRSSTQIMREKGLELEIAGKPLNALTSVKHSPA